mmetsp:Transcript_23826/g.38659  ORF Transcript_23826/g.38659 Transcript_23826/m.38659 type:complete len:259 (+) Transcript_23826:89-865(+)
MGHISVMLLLVVTVHWGIHYISQPSIVCFGSMLLLFFFHFIKRRFHSSRSSTHVQIAHALLHLILARLLLSFPDGTQLLHRLRSLFANFARYALVLEDLQHDLSNGAGYIYNSDVPHHLDHRGQSVLVGSPPRILRGPRGRGGVPRGVPRGVHFHARLLQFGIHALGPTSDHFRGYEFVHGADRIQYLFSVADLDEFPPFGCPFCPSGFCIAIHECLYPVAKCHCQSDHATSFQLHHLLLCEIFRLGRTTHERLRHEL